MNKREAIVKLNQRKEIAATLLNKPHDCQEFKKWQRDTEIAIENIFGPETRHRKDFVGIHYTLLAFCTDTPDYRFQEAFKEGVQTAITLFDSFIDEIQEYWAEDEIIKTKAVEPIQQIELIINRFHHVVRQLRSRRSNRPTIEVEDEYDVQDLFHALLRLYFDDIRPEEYAPSHGGAASRVDFLLKQEKIVIEIKKNRRGLTDKEIGEQLIIDSQRYQALPDCSQLICFVYDPENRIKNPRGLENDLSKEINGVPVKVIITPK